MSVTLRKRTNGKKISLYLDYYVEGKRQYEYLNLYLSHEPENGKLPKQERDANNATLEMAEAIRSKRLLGIRNEEFGFRDTEKAKGSFLAYFQMLTNKRKNSIGNYGNWDSALKHLQKFAPRGVSFKQVNKEWLEQLKEYFQETARSENGKRLSQNTQCSYFSKMSAALKEAVKDGIILNNPAVQIRGIKHGDPEREFLTLEELQSAAKVECELPLLKNAFLFSALTGLRWSDIEKLVWSEVQHSDLSGYFIRFRQKKTKGAETLPISEQAFHLMGERRRPADKVFQGLIYSAWNNLKLREWIMKAGIIKHITFHCARHTYATLQITLGTDIYTVSKLLGHKHLKTTEVYAKVIDHKKQDAAKRICIELPATI
ncbi:MAG TPA: site-specific integrase [Chitinophagaceae bacterium]|jgi:integrase|nr:site-specific integrase [Chitinophagaceae bacterium]